MGVGAAAALGGVALYAFDQPTASLAKARLDEKQHKPEAPKSREPTEMTFTPVVAPTFAGASFVGKF